MADDVLKVVDSDAAAKKWRYTDDEAQTITQYLEEGVYYEAPAIGGVSGIARTAEGIDYATNSCFL